MTERERDNKEVTSDREREEEEDEICNVVDKNTETRKDERREREMEGIFIRHVAEEERVFI